jgi:ATP-binding cassette subfamily B (MDR/TAP) protein 1
MRSFAVVFLHADAADVTLMLLGLLGAIGDGMAAPLMFVIISRVYDNAGSTPDRLGQFSSKMNEVHRFHASPTSG